MRNHLDARCGETYRVKRGKPELEHLQNCHVDCPLSQISHQLAQSAAQTGRPAWHERVVALPLQGGTQVHGVYILHLQDEARPFEEAFLELGTALVALGLHRTREADHLRGREAQRNTLIHQLLFAQEEERRRVGRELHDEVGSQLTAALLALQITEKRPE